MSVAFGNGGGQGGEFVAELTITSVTTTGSDRVGIAGVGGGTDFGTVTVAWGGNSMTSEGSATIGTAFAQAFSLIAPPEASSSIVYSSSTNILGGCVWLYVTGASQADAVSASDTDSSAAGAMSGTPASASGDMGVVVGGVAGGTLTSVDGTEVVNVHNGDSQYFGAIAYKASSGSTVTLGYTCDDDGAIVVVNIPQSASGTIEQAVFAFGDDDGNEAAHTLDSEDTNATEDLGTVKTIRFLLQATDDPSSAAYTLRAQKNGSGGYTAVGVGSSYKIQPVIEAADVTQSGNNTASTSWAVSVPALATGDQCIIHIGWDDSLDTTDVSEPAGPDSETINEVIATPITDAGTTIRAKAWWFVATDTYAGGTLTFTPSASEQWSAHVVKVPAGEFDSGDPIGEADDVAGGADSEVDSPAFSAGATDGTGTLIWFPTVNADPLLTVPSGWTELDKSNLGAVESGVAVRIAAVTDSESIASAIWPIASDTWASIALIVRAPTITPEIFIATSANVTAGGEATTNRLTGGTGSFVTGRRWDNENGSDSIDLTTDNFTEVEWVIDTQSPAVGGDYWDLRVYAGSSALDIYTVTPRLTLNGGAASVGLIPVILQNYRNMGYKM